MGYLVTALLQIPGDCKSEKNLKISQYLMKLCLKYYWFLFFRTRCIMVFRPVIWCRVIAVTFAIFTKGCSVLNHFCAVIFTAQCTLVHMRGLGIACRPSVRLSVRPSVTLVDCDHISWKSWKLTAPTISPTPSLFVATRRSTYSQGNMGKFGGD